MISDPRAWLEIGVEAAVLSILESDDDSTLLAEANALGKYGSTAGVEPLDRAHAIGTAAKEEGVKA
ncbi:MAG: hypothetical protein IPK13_27410 [Deltaproteobacteria bacterium]|nr:hypothetical protein [Deltaproteobacteria bacterium]